MEKAAKQPATTPVPRKISANDDTIDARSSVISTDSENNPSNASTIITSSSFNLRGGFSSKFTVGGTPGGPSYGDEDYPLYQDMDTCFKAFDKDGDGFLNATEFGALCRALFRNEKGKPYPVDPSMLGSLFTIFDRNKDNVIDKEEFRFCWQKWIKQVVRPITALVIVDVQNDFISGSLSISNCPAGHDGEEVIAPINKMLDEIEFDAIVYSLDWHPSDHVSFIDNVQNRPLHKTCKISLDELRVMDVVYFDILDKKQEQKLWPRHCVQESWGAELHKDLKVIDGSLFVKKGTDSNVDSYSAFWDNNKLSCTNLNELLENRNITDVFVCGIAYDVCVGATATHANEHGYRTLLIDDACRGVSEDDIRITKEEFVNNYGLVVHSTQVKNLASGRDRPPALAYKLALELSKKNDKIH